MDALNLKLFIHKIILIFISVDNELSLFRVQ